MLDLLRRVVGRGRGLAIESAPVVCPSVSVAIPRPMVVSTPVIVSKMDLPDTEKKSGIPPSLLQGGFSLVLFHEGYSARVDCGTVFLSALVAPEKARISTEKWFEIQKMIQDAVQDPSVVKYAKGKKFLQEVRVFFPGASRGGSLGYLYFPRNTSYAISLNFSS